LIIFKKIVPIVEEVKYDKYSLLLNIVLIL